MHFLSGFISHQVKLVSQLFTLLSAGSADLVVEVMHSSSYVVRFHSMVVNLNHQ